MFHAEKKRSFKVYKEAPHLSSLLRTFQSSGNQTSVGEMLKKMKKRKSSRSKMTCRVNGSMKGEPFSQRRARANCLSKQINLKCLA